MAQDRGEDTLTVEAVECIGVGMADARRHDLNEHFTCFWSLKIEFDNFKRLLCLKCDGSTGFHLAFLRSCLKFALSLRLQQVNMVCPQ